MRHGSSPWTQSWEISPPCCMTLQECPAVLLCPAPGLLHSGQFLRVIWSGFPRGSHTLRIVHFLCKGPEILFLSGKSVSWTLGRVGNFCWQLALSYPGSVLCISNSYGRVTLASPVSGPGWFLVCQKAKCGRVVLQELLVTQKKAMVPQITTGFGDVIQGKRGTALSHREIKDTKEGTIQYKRITIFTKYAIEQVSVCLCLFGADFKINKIWLLLCLVYFLSSA